MPMHARARRPHAARVVPMAVVVASVVALLTACGGGDPAAGAPRPTGAAADDAVLLTGRRVWARQCATCHGLTGREGATPHLAGSMVARFPRAADEERLVRQGRGIMPGWGGKLTAAEIAAVVRYTREVL